MGLERREGEREEWRGEGGIGLIDELVCDKWRRRRGSKTK